MPKTLRETTLGLGPLEEGQFHIAHMGQLETLGQYVKRIYPNTTIAKRLEIKNRIAPLIQLARKDAVQRVKRAREAGAL